jgi:hypothetical protein
MPTFYMKNRYNLLILQSIHENGGGKIRPKQLAALALGVLRRKLPQLELALTGQCTEHHAWLIQGA